MDDEYQIGSLEEFSDSKNAFGVKMEKAEPIGSFLVVAGVTLTLMSIVTLFFYPSFGVFALVFVFGMLSAFSMVFRVSERGVMRFSKRLQESAQEQNTPKSSMKSVCRECHEEVSPDVKRCPNCGWKPKKRGGLWWGTTAVTSLSPIGWVLGAKGVSDNYKAAKGVAKEVPAEEQKSSEETEDQPSKEHPTETLERLNDLKIKGVITEEDFEEKKKELLEKI
ncbi:SHOCT domain-containing protein [Haloferax sp. S1W]|uniref:SHOCT domain-containing protein n=1 Tax=Haloferax sp. S1W TaxID=3377110 RepID=UPI0037C5A384